MSDQAPEGKPDVNTDAGFAAALAAKVGKPAPELPEGYESPSVADGLTFDEPAPQPRTEEGQFAPTTPPAPEAPTQPVQQPPTGTPEPQLFESDDPEIQEFLTKYGGDLGKALKVGANNERLLGRQANEVGDLRKEIEAIKAERQQQPTAPAPQAQPQFLIPQQHEVEYVEEGVAQRGGQALAVEALNAGREDLAKVAIRAWSVDDPDGAMEFWGRYNAAKAEVAREQAAPAPAAPATPEPQAPVMALPPEVEALVLRERAGAILADMQAIAPDDFNAIRGHVLDALGSLPAELQALATDPSAEKRAAGLRVVLDVARARAGTALATTAAAAQHTRQVEAKKATGLVTGGLRPVSPPGNDLGYDPDKGPLPENMPEAERKAIIKARLKKAFAETETTSVADGLTYDN